MNVYEILNYLSRFLDKYDKINYDFSNLMANCEIKNFIKLSNKYEHSKFIKDIPNVVKSCEIDKETTGTVNIVKKKINKRRKMKLGKSSKVAIKIKNETKMKKEKERKMMTIGKPVRLNIKFNDIRNMNGKVYQLGLRIGSKNTTTMKKLKQAFKIGRFDKKNEMESNIDKIKEMESNIEVELQTNTTAIENGFWFYFLIIIKENQEISLSEPFTLLSYKQLTKRKDKSFLKKQEEYMLNNKESIFPYYFESMFYCNVKDNQYKLKNTFTFGIKFFQERRNENNCNVNSISNFITDKMDENTELTKETEDLMKDFKELYPILSDIPIENSNIDINQKSVSTTNYPLSNYNLCDTKNNGYASPSNSISDIIPNNDDQSTVRTPLPLQLSSPFPFNNNFDGSYAINGLLSLIYEQKSIINELKRLNNELNNLYFMNNYDINIKNNIYNMLNQRESLLQKFEERKKEKEYLEEIIYNCKIKYFSLKRDETFLSDLNSKKILFNIFQLIQ
ncbi:hypothetical protein H8356DRAFT_1292230 [Neocallimastix lanati (nom. inval.)]|nr:hypothetical protein H8356DRAFT_1292230 [Neocallimastix sp. JGI-2020a]